MPLLLAPELSLRSDSAVKNVQWRYPPPMLICFDPIKHDIRSLSMDGHRYSISDVPAGAHFPFSMAMSINFCPCSVINPSLIILSTLSLLDGLQLLVALRGENL